MISSSKEISDLESFIDSYHFENEQMQHQIPRGGNNNGPPPPPSSQGRFGSTSSEYGGGYPTNPNQNGTDLWGEQSRGADWRQSGTGGGMNNMRNEQYEHKRPAIQERGGWNNNNRTGMDPQQQISGGGLQQMMMENKEISNFLFQQYLQNTNNNNTDQNWQILQQLGRMAVSSSSTNANDDNNASGDAAFNQQPQRPNSSASGVGGYMNNNNTNNSGIYQPPKPSSTGTNAPYQQPYNGNGVRTGVNQPRGGPSVQSGPQLGGVPQTGPPGPQLGGFPQGGPQQPQKWSSGPDTSFNRQRDTTTSYVTSQRGELPAYNNYTHQILSAQQQQRLMMSSSYDVNQANMTSLMSEHELQELCELRKKIVSGEVVVVRKDLMAKLTLSDGDNKLLQRHNSVASDDAVFDKSVVATSNAPVGVYRPPAARQLSSASDSSSNVSGSGGVHAGNQGNPPPPTNPAGRAPNSFYKANSGRTRSRGDEDPDWRNPLHRKQNSFENNNQQQRNQQTNNNNQQQRRKTSTTNDNKDDLNWRRKDNGDHNVKSVTYNNSSSTPTSPAANNKNNQFATNNNNKNNVTTPPKKSNNMTTDKQTDNNNTTTKANTSVNTTSTNHGNTSARLVSDASKKNIYDWITKANEEIEMQNNRPSTISGGGQPSISVEETFAQLKLDDANGVNIDESQLSAFMQRVQQQANTEDKLRAYADDLCERAVKKCGFGYGASLLVNKMSHMMIEDKSTKFRSMVFRNIQKRYEAREKLFRDSLEGNDDRFFGFVHFLFHCYVNVIVPNRKPKERFSVFTKPVYDCLMLMLNEPSVYYDHIKLFGEMFWLIGQSLEEDNPKLMTELMKEIRDKSVVSKAPSVRNVYKRCVKMYSTRWESRD